MNVGLDSPQRMCSGLVRAPRATNVPVTGFLAPETPVVLAGLSGAQSTPKLQPAGAPAAKARPGLAHAHFPHPASGPEAASVPMRTRPGTVPLGGEMPGR